MSIKYAELNIIRNLEEESIFCYLKRMMGNENKVTDNDTLIISFDDSTICDVKKEYIDKHYDFGLASYKSLYPSYFENENLLFLLKHPNFINGNKTLNFKNIFNKNPKLKTSKQYSSVYNAIYTNNTDEVFSIVKNSLNDIKPAYLIAYNDKFFERGDVVYLVSYIFKLSDSLSF